MNPIIVALDLENATEALQLVDRIGDAVGFYKVGLELFTAEGPSVVGELTARGKQVFVDLKMYDIGATVERATARVAALGASFLTVHSSPQVIRAAVRGRGESGLKILAVTVLTSFDNRNGLRPMLGKSVTCWLLTTCPWEAFDVSTMGAASVTSTLSVMAPTSSFRSAVTSCWVPTVRPLRSNFLKPTDSTCSV